MEKRLRVLSRATAMTALITAGVAAPIDAAQATGPTSTCAAAYQVLGSWPGGAQALMTVTNTGSSTLNGWTVRFTLASGSTIMNVFNGANTGSTGSVTVTNRPFNAMIAAHASTLVGIIASGTGPATATDISCTSP